MHIFLPPLGINGAGVNNMAFTNNGYSYARYIAVAYLGCSGGTRYKIVSSNINTRYKAIVQTNVPGQVATSIVDLGRGSSYMDSLMSEYEIPSYITQNFTMASRAFVKSAVTGSPVNCLVFQANNTDAIGDKIHVYYSTADDFILKGFLCAPRATII